MKTRILFLSLVALLLGVSLCGCQIAAPDQPEPVTETSPSEVLSLELPGPDLPDLETLLQYTSLQQLDARNVKLTVSEYEQLKKDLPNCEILWRVPFQGNYVDPETTELTISELSADDLKSIACFPSLEHINAEGCHDYEQLLALEDVFPNISVYYTIPLGGMTYSNGAARQICYLELWNADVSELTELLPYFTNVNEVRFIGTAPANDDIYDLMCQYPEIAFKWDLTLFGITTPNTASTLILSGIPMEDTTELESYLKYFPNLERVEVCDCGLSSEEMDALSQRYPDIRFVWTIKVGNGTLRTDVTAFIPYKFGYHLHRPLYDADCTELKYCIDMVCLDLGHMKIRDFSFLQYMPKMKYLIVADTPCQDFSAIANLKELIYLEIFVTSFTETEILLGLTKLEDLNLGTTPVNDITSLKQMTWLKRLWIPATKLNHLQVAELKESLPNTRIMVYADHSTDKGWRKAKNYYDMRDLLGMFYME